MNESRKSKRYGYLRGASLQRLPAAAPPAWARIRDVSEGGCLLELDLNRTKLELNEVVELLFGANEDSFRTRAQVRVLRPRNLVGFEFIDVSDRRIGQLREFIRELAVEEELCS